MRQEERKTIQAAVIGAVLFLLIQIFRTPLSQIENQDVMLALYLIAGCCNIAFGFAVFAQGGLFFSDKLSKARLYISALFLGICTFDFLHILSFVGIPAISSIISQDQSLWLLTFSRLASALGILFIFSKEDEPVSIRGKKKVFAVSLVVIALSLMLIIFSDILTPGLQTYSWLSTVKHLIDMAVLFIYLLSVGMIVYPGRIEKSASLLIIIRALIFLHWPRCSL